MQPIERYASCVATLNTCYRAIQQDIFAENYRRGVGYYIYSLIFIFFLSNYYYTVFMYESDSTEIMITLTLGCAVVQVILIILGSITIVQSTCKF